VNPGSPPRSSAFEAGRRFGVALGVLICAVLNGLLVAAAVFADITAWRSLG
jgi:hypothetical protein